ncbi:hypothetical protein [Subtercola sp. YIM 133946]|uniref:hypothetical protein n=1 Tax=Subtercola sp. YIM 133946 TaxID=3118909 RepID=UPI002F91EB82
MMWPDGMRIGPIREWPGTLTPASQRQFSRFKTSGYDGGYARKSVPLSSTLELLDRELSALGSTDREMLVAIAPADFRLDGKPRAQARAEHPGVIISFKAKLGALSYPCDTFTTWQDNLRAIALALEALRKVDRYGVTKHGEQYRGFMAIEGTAIPSRVTSVQQALDVLYAAAGVIVEPGVIYEPEGLARIARRALFKTHPDQGGDAAVFQRVIAAQAFLEKAGAL